MAPQAVSHSTSDGKIRTQRLWHVERLWELAKDLPIKEVSIGSISALDEINWFGQYPTCRQVAEEAKKIYEVQLDHPIVLSAAGWVMDGMHRICKAYLLGMKTISAVQFIEDPEPDETSTSDV